MGVLRALLRRVDLGLVGQIVRAELVGDEAARLGQRLPGDARGIGPHVSDQPNRTLLPQVHSLIELLGDGHGLPGGETQTPGGVLLEGGGDKRGKGPAAALFSLDLGDPIFRSLQVGQDLLGPGLVRDFRLFPVDPVQGRLERRGGVDRHPSGEGPVFHRNELFNLVFAVADDAQGDRLDAPGAQPPVSKASAQERTQLIAHQPIQDPAGLLGLDLVPVDLPGLRDRPGHGLFGDLVEGDPVDLGAGDELDLLLDMPSDGLAFPVGVRRQVDGVAFGGGRLELGQDLALALDDFVLGGEAVLDVHAQLLGGEISQMPHRGGHAESLVQKFLEGGGLGGRLDDE